MDRCSCGRPVNHRMHGKCLACRYEEEKRPKARAQKKQPAISPSTPEEVLASPRSEGWSGTIWLKPKTGGRATLRIAPDKLPYRGEPTRESHNLTWEDIELEKLYKYTHGVYQAESP